MKVVVLNTYANGSKHLTGKKMMALNTYLRGDGFKRLFGEMVIKNLIILTQGIRLSVITHKCQNLD